MAHRERFLRVLAVAVALAATFPCQIFSAQFAPESDPPCQLSQNDTNWVQRAPDVWGHVSRGPLRAESTELPWVVLFDRSCVWHLAARESLAAEAGPVTAQLSYGGKPVALRAMPHEGTVRLPNGVDIPVKVRASTSPFELLHGAIRSGEASRGLDPLDSEHLSHVFGSRPSARQRGVIEQSGLARRSLEGLRRSLASPAGR